MSDFDVVRQLNEKNTLGVVNADLGEEYESALFQLDDLEELVETAREELETDKVFVHLAEDQPVLISLWADAHASVGLSPIVSVDKYEEMNDDSDNGGTGAE